MSKIDETKWRYWKKQIANWEASGLSQRAYCARENVSFFRFDYWRRKVRTPNPPLPRAQKPMAPAQLRLLPVQIDASQDNPALVLHSPHGWRLALPPRTDADWLAAFLRALS
jgi:hypothetical protein